MGIFEKKEKKDKASKLVPTKAPVEPETQGEVNYTAELDSPKTETQETPVAEPEEIKYREVPVCMSQAQINNLIIENNIMLKQIISEMDN